MKQSWRWYGPDDPVSLSDILQAGATDVVSALHHIQNGEIWPKEEIDKRKDEISSAGLIWSVVESVPVHEDIKKRTGEFSHYISNYNETLENLSSCGISTVCYNFMPVLDWTRTDLNKEMPDGSRALYFDSQELAVFELFILNRQEARTRYSNEEIEEAEKLYESMSSEHVDRIIKNLIAGLPGAEEHYSLKDFRNTLDEYKEIDSEILQQNLALFLQDIIPTAEQHGVKMCIHPDDPPYPILGLPRVVSTMEDIQFIYEAYPSYYNGLTFCTGSFGVREDNDLPDMVRKLGEKIHFVHLRNVKRKDDDFYEANHLEGSVDMFGVMDALIEQMNKRKEGGRSDYSIPVRPDHGHQMLDDLDKQTNPGYSAIGRLRGLAELRGLELGILGSQKK